MGISLPHLSNLALSLNLNVPRLVNMNCTPMVVFSIRLGTHGLGPGPPDLGRVLRRQRGKLDLPAMWLLLFRDLDRAVSSSYGGLEPGHQCRRYRGPKSCGPVGGVFALA